MREKAAAEAAVESCRGPDTMGEASRCSQSWAMLIKRVYEVDPLSCPKCGGQMAVVAFIEPPQADEKQPPPYPTIEQQLTALVDEMSNQIPAFLGWMSTSSKSRPAARFASSRGPERIKKPP
jgi:hypothetical protein